MKVVVYAICKNEEKNVELWYNSMQKADEIYCLDTSSAENIYHRNLNSDGTSRISFIIYNTHFCHCYS